MDRNAADSLLRLGFSLIPVKDKKPLVKWQEHQSRKATKEEVHGWLSRYPNCDLGIVTGSVSGILVLDADKPLAHPVPRTWTVKTKRGYGRHFYFKWDRAYETATTTKAGILQAGWDIRGDGGYVVAPGSEGYRFTNPPGVAPLAEAPGWLRAVLCSEQRGPSLGSGDKHDDGRALHEEGDVPRIVSLSEGLKEGNRNDSFARLAGIFRRQGLKANQIFDLLRGRALECGFALGELQAVCESVARYAPSIHAPVPSEATDIGNFLRDEEPVEWHCKDLIPKKGIGFVAGLPESCKTWLLVDLSVTLSSQTVSSSPKPLWLGRFPVSGARTLFLDQERYKGETQRRFKAVIRGKGLTPADLGDRLLVRCGSTTRLDMDNSYEAFRRELANTRPEVVVVDSFATFSTADENNRQSIQIVLERVKRLRDEFGTAFIFIDHENKSAWQDSSDGVAPSAFRMVGSVAKPAAAEFVFTVRKQDSETSTVYHTKSTMSSTTEPFTVRVRDLNEEKTSIAVEAL